MKTKSAKKFNNLFNTFNTFLELKFTKIRFFRNLFNNFELNPKPAV